jgi:transcriptional regulator with XRE-family HTH domain
MRDMSKFTNPDQLDVAIGATIRIRRKQAGISQQLVAERCGITFQQVQKYENGRNRISFSRLVKIAHVLGVRVAELVGDIDQAVGVGTNDTDVLVNLAMAGAKELLDDYVRLPEALRRSIQHLVRELANSQTPVAEVTAPLDRQIVELC